MTKIWIDVIIIHVHKKAIKFLKLYRNKITRNLSLQSISKNVVEPINTIRYSNYILYGRCTVWNVGRTYSI